MSGAGMRTSAYLLKGVGDTFQTITEVTYVEPTPYFTGQENPSTPLTEQK